MSRSYDSMIKKLHSALKIDDFWPQFLQALSVEFDGYLIDNDLSKEYKNIYFNYSPTQEEFFIQNLQRLAVKYGYTPNLILDSSASFLKAELASVAYKIINKTTITGYLYPIHQVERLGEVYNFIYNDSKLLKNIVWGTENSTGDSILKWYATHSASDFILPFTNVYADRNYSTVVDNRVSLDTGRTLDESPSWYIDGIKFAPTKHLGIEYYLDRLVTKSAVEYLIHSDYLRYLEQATDYNRHMNVVTHTGVSLNFVVPATQAYNYYDGSKSYTIPNLKLKAQSTFLRGNKTLADAHYISIGTGTKALPATADNLLFIKENMKLAYSMQLEGLSVPESITGINGTVVGNIYPTTGIFGQEVNFDGATYVLSDNTFSATDGDYTLTTWIKYSETTNTDDCIFDCGLFKMTLNSVTKYVKIYLGDVLQITYTLTGQSAQNNLLFLAIRYTASSDILALYVNGIPKISTSALYTFTIPSKVSFGVSLINNTTPSTDYFKGLISNFCVFNKLLQNFEILNIYNNELIFNSCLANRFYRAPISSDERATSTNWTGVNTYLPSFTINEKTVFKYVSPTTNYKGTLQSTVVPHTLNFLYQYTNNSIIFDDKVSDDGTGILKNDVLQGNIDYETGAYNLDLFRVHDSSFFYTIDNPIKIVLSNVQHTFPYSNTGVINYKGSGTSITVWEGNTALTADQTASFGNGTFRVTTTNPTNIKVGSMSGDGTNTLTFGNHSQLGGEHASIVYTIIVKNKQGVETTYERTQSFAKSLNSKAVRLVSTDYAFIYNEEGYIPSPTSTTLTATSFNMIGSVYYDFLINDISVQNSTASTLSYTPPASSNSLPQTIRVDVRENASTGTIVATDYIQMISVSNALIGTSFSTSLLSQIGHTNIDIVANSLKIYYKIKDSFYYTTDNGDTSGGNNIFGIALVGKINYDTGELTLSTTNDPIGNPYQLQAPIQISFQYKKYTDLLNGSCFSAEYKTRDNILITELAIEDEYKQALVYATFPPIEFNSLENYLATNVMLPIVS